MTYLKGYVDHIRFRNEDNGYTVLSLDVDGDEETVVGLFPFLNEGEYISMEGDYVDHPVHGPQFQMRTYEIVAPDDIDSMERYLGSGAIKGIGPALAKRITKKFKMDTFRVIEEEPERLAEVKGISEKKARAIAVEFSEKQEMRQAMMFLSGYGINNNLAVKIYKEYGDHLYTIIQENPYKMTDDIAGVGFKIADEIAKKVGIGSNSDYRIISGIFYTLMRALNEGHVFLPKHILCRNAAHILGVTPEDIEEHLLEMMIDRKIVIEEDKETRVYAASQYHMEVNTARMLLDLNIHYDISVSEVETMIAMIEENEQITFAEKQKEAIHAVAEDSIVILTGGPGTGKTTTINGMIQYFEHEGLDIRLAAPTGRAAKRMTEATGYQAMTIHRLLEINGEADKERDLRKGATMFERNAGNPLETDVIIIDEMSMVDTFLMHAFLKEKWEKRCLKVCTLTSKTFSNFLTGQCLEALILGSMFFVAMSLFKMPYALLVGVLVAFTALIPIFGAFIGCVVGAFLILMVDPLQALFFVIMFLVLQQIEGNLIYPKVVGNSVGLPSIWVLAAVTIGLPSIWVLAAVTLGGNLMGITGMLIFIPLVSVVYTLFRESVYKRLEQKQR